MDLKEFLAMLVEQGAAEVRLTIAVTDAEVLPAKCEDATCCEQEGCGSQCCECGCGECDEELPVTEEKCSCSNAADRALFGEKPASEGCTGGQVIDHTEAGAKSNKEDNDKCIAQVVRVTVRRK